MSKKVSMYDYEKVLSERNKLLKQTKTFDSLYDTIDLWDTQLAEIAAKISSAPISYLSSFLVFLLIITHIADNITPTIEIVLHFDAIAYSFCLSLNLVIKPACFDST